MRIKRQRGASAGANSHHMACKQEANIVLINGFKTEKEDVSDEKPADLEKHVEVVVRTWALVKQDMLKHGVVFYLRLFSENTDMQGMFPFASNARVVPQEDDPGLERQARLLMSMIDYAVRCLGNIGELIPKLKRLGRKHFVKYHVKAEHFQPVGESLLWTLKTGLGELYTRDVEAAWTAIYTILADVMIEGGLERLAEESADVVDNE